MVGSPQTARRREYRVAAVVLDEEAEPALFELGKRSGQSIDAPAQVEGVICVYIELVAAQPPVRLPQPVLQLLVEKFPVDIEAYPLVGRVRRTDFRIELQVDVGAGNRAHVPQVIVFPDAEMRAAEELRVVLCRGGKADTDARRSFVWMPCLVDILRRVKIRDSRTDAVTDRRFGDDDRYREESLFLRQPVAPRGRRAWSFALVLAGLSALSPMAPVPMQVILRKRWQPTVITYSPRREAWIS